MIPRLEDLALQKYLDLIKELCFEQEQKIKRKAAKSTVQKIRNNFPPSEVKGLAAVVASVIYDHSKYVLPWETMKNILQKSLIHLEILERKKSEILKNENLSFIKNIQIEDITLVAEVKGYEADIHAYPESKRYGIVLKTFIQEMSKEERRSVHSAEEMIKSLSLLNLKEVCILVDSQAKEILSQCDASKANIFKNEFLRTISKLKSIDLKIIQEIKMTIKKYLDTGPYTTWQEMQSEFIKYLMQHPVLCIFANKLSEFLINYYCVGYKKRTFLSKHEEVIIEACIHPDITKLNAVKISTNQLLDLLPKFQNLNTLEVGIRINASLQVTIKDGNLISCISRHCSKLKSLCITLCSCILDNEGILLEQALTSLPSTLQSISFRSIKELPTVKFLDRMAMSEKFQSLNGITLINLGSAYPLHRSFSNLTAVTCSDSFTTVNKLFKNVGGWLKKISLSRTNIVDIGQLSVSCPCLETLELEDCIFTAHAQPIPVFRALKEIRFINGAYYQSKGKGLTCVWCILQNSAKIERMMFILHDVKLGSCFWKLMGTNQMAHLQEFELYEHHRRTIQGLVTADLALDMINTHPSLKYIGGVEHLETQNKLHEMFPSRTFMCQSEQVKKYQQRFSV